MGSEVAVSDAHPAPMLLGSIDPSSEMEIIAAALRTKDGDFLTWDNFATTLINEYNARSSFFSKGSKYMKRKGRKSGKRLTGLTIPGNSSDDLQNDDSTIRTLRAAVENLKGSNVNTDKNDREFCGKRGRSKEKGFLNPDNPANKLSPKMRE